MNEKLQVNAAGGLNSKEYRKAQLEWLKVTGLKKGDRVKVIGKAEDKQAGWATNWVSPAMDNATGEIESIDDRYGVQIIADNGLSPSYWYPFFVLIRDND